MFVLCYELLTNSRKYNVLCLVLELTSLTLDSIRMVNMSGETYFIGVDVGTGSARAALVNKEGSILKVHSHPIITWNPKPKFYQQSSTDIWNACCVVIKEVSKDINPKAIKGIGFDATCSLVALDTNEEPLTISPTGENEQNIILWMDHRAEQEAEFINKKGHSVLQYVGGKISLEMEIPKLMWLKKHLKKECWEKVGMFFDLPDFLTWKATGAESRSLCSLVCKWTYEIHSDGTEGWSESFFKLIDLDELLEDNCKKIGRVVLTPGKACDGGLSQETAKNLGLLPGTPVGTSIIDAHAGGLGMIGCSVDCAPTDFHTRLGLICGTSTCHMIVSLTPTFVSGVWGPYYSAMVPGMWLNEGGQSATGKLVDYIIDSHPATPKILNKLNNEMHIQQYLSNLLKDLTKKHNLQNMSMLTKDVHIWPDFHGNRSPLADSNLKGMISGLSLSSNEENLAILYLATLQALAYGTRHIMDNLKKSGHKDILSILICGGLSRNPLFVQIQADVINLPVLVPFEKESVLLGSAILGAFAAGCFPNMRAAIQTMAGEAKFVHPYKNVTKFHNKKYKVFLKMLEHQREYDTIMNS